MCRFEILDMCTKGTACEFAHSQAEMQSQPDLARTKLCKTLLATGGCRDVRCTYAHSALELRPMEAESLPAPSRRAGRAMGGNAPRVPAIPAQAARKPFEVPLGFGAADFGDHWRGFAPQMPKAEAAFTQLDAHGMFGPSYNSYPSASGFERSALYMPPAAPDHVGLYSQVRFHEVAAASSSDMWWQTGFGQQYGAVGGDGGSRPGPWPTWPNYGFTDAAHQAPLEPDDCWASSVGDVSTCDPEDSHRMEDTDFRRRPIRLVRSADGALCTLGYNGFEAVTL